MSDCPELEAGLCHTDEGREKVFAIHRRIFAARRERIAQRVRARAAYGHLTRVLDPGIVAPPSIETAKNEEVSE